FSSAVACGGRALATPRWRFPVADRRLEGHGRLLPVGSGGTGGAFGSVCGARGGGSGTIGSRRGARARAAITRGQRATGRPRAAGAHGSDAIAGRVLPMLRIVL